MEKTIMEEQNNKKMRKEAEDYVYKTYREDKPTYDLALKLVSKLGVGGLWRGVNLAMMHTIKALQEAKRVA